jgi:hypothetical protein
VFAFLSIVNYHPNGATHYRLNGATYRCSRRMLKLRYDCTTFPWVGCVLDVSKPA